MKVNEFYLATFFSSILTAVAARNIKQNLFQVELTKVVIDADPSFMSVSYEVCNTYLLNMNITTHQTIETGNTLLSMVVKIHSGASDFFQILLKFNNNDFCQYATTTAKDPLFRVALRKIRPHTNILGCPIEPGVYYLRNFTANNIIPVGIIPDGEYIMNAVLQYKNIEKSFANFTIVVNVVN